MRSFLLSCLFPRDVPMHGDGGDEAAVVAAACVGASGADAANLPALRGLSAAAAPAAAPLPALRTASRLPGSPSASTCGGDASCSRPSSSSGTFASLGTACSTDTCGLAGALPGALPRAWLDPRPGSSCGDAPTDAAGGSPHPHGPLYRPSPSSFAATPAAAAPGAPPREGAHHLASQPLLVAAAVPAAPAPALAGLHIALAAYPQAGLDNPDVHIKRLRLLALGPGTVVYRGTWQGMHVAAKFMLQSGRAPPHELQAAAAALLLAPGAAHQHYLVRTYACDVSEVVLVPPASSAAGVAPTSGGGGGGVQQPQPLEAPDGRTRGAVGAAAAAAAAAAQPGASEQQCQQPQLAPAGGAAVPTMELGLRACEPAVDGAQAPAASRLGPSSSLEGPGIMPPAGCQDVASAVSRGLQAAAAAGAATAGFAAGASTGRHGPSAPVLPAGCSAAASTGGAAAWCQSSGSFSLAATRCHFSSAVFSSCPLPSTAAVAAIKAGGLDAAAAAAWPPVTTAAVGPSPSAAPVRSSGSSCRALHELLTDLGAQPGDRLLHVISELADGGSLAAPAGGACPVASLEELVQVARQVAQALQQLHRAGVVHGALTPRNVLLRCDHGPGAVHHHHHHGRSFTACLADCGLRRLLLGDAWHEHLASSPDLARCSAPEVLSGLPPTDPAADIWSFGCLLHFLAVGVLPHSQLAGAAEVAAEVARGEGPAWPQHVWAPLRGLGQACMAMQPGQRPAAGTLVKALLVFEQRLRNQSRAAAMRPAAGGHFTRSGSGGAVQAMAPAGHDATTAGAGPYQPSSAAVSARARRSPHAQQHHHHYTHHAAVPSSFSSGRVSSGSGAGGMGHGPRLDKSSTGSASSSASAVAALLGSEGGSLDDVQLLMPRRPGPLARTSSPTLVV